MKNLMAFNEEELIRRIARLPVSLRVAFATSCAERQFLAYRDFQATSGFGNAILLREALDDLWTRPTITLVERAKMQDELRAVTKLIPKEDEVQPWTATATFAQNAALSVAYALRARMTGESKEAAYAARMAYDSLDHSLMSREPGTFVTMDAEQRVLANPIVQTELTRQHRDLKELLDTGNDATLRRVAARLRERASKEANEFLHDVLGENGSHNTDS